MRKSIVFPLLSMLLLSSCAKNTQTATSDSTGTAATTTVATKNATSTTPGSAVNPAAVSDASILDELEAFDSNAINQARYVKFHTRNKDILAFANTMWTDHLKFIKSGQTITRKDKINPSSPGLTQDKAMMAANMTSLEAADSNLDYVYVSRAVEDNTALRNNLQQWRTQAQNPYLKAKIENDLPIVAEHLERAQLLRNKLNGK